MPRLNNEVLEDICKKLDGLNVDEMQKLVCRLEGILDNLHTNGIPDEQLYVVLEYLLNKIIDEKLDFADITAELDKLSQINNQQLIQSHITNDLLKEIADKIKPTIVEKVVVQKEIVEKEVEKIVNHYHTIYVDREGNRTEPKPPVIKPRPTKDEQTLMHKGEWCYKYHCRCKMLSNIYCSSLHNTNCGEHCTGTTFLQSDAQREGQKRLSEIEARLLQQEQENQRNRQKYCCC